MPTPIDFRTFETFTSTTRAALERADLLDEQVEMLRQTVAADGISVHSINSSGLSDGEKGVAALLMLLRDQPGDSKLSRISTNLAEFFDRVAAGKERSFQQSLRTDALGSDPFESWGSLRVQAFDQGTFELADAGSTKAIRLEPNEAGEIDVSQAQSWTPDALKTALDQLAASGAPSDNPLMQRLRGRLDQLEANVIQRAHAALNQVREEKLGSLATSAQALERAIADPKSLDYQVPQASIDAIGHALASAADRPPADADADGAVFAVGLAQLKTDVATALVSLDDRTSKALVAAMERLSKIANPELTMEAARRAGISHDALRLLTLFRAVDASLEAAGVHETIRNHGTIREATEALLGGTGLDAALQTYQVQLNDPDPFALHRGRAFTPETPIRAVDAVAGDAGITGYSIVTDAGTWTLGPQGITDPEHAAGEASPITDYSITALRTLTSVLLTASPDAVSGPLAYFRRTEERTSGGFSYAELLANLSAALAQKVTDRMAAIDEVVVALAPLVPSKAERKRKDS